MSIIPSTQTINDDFQCHLISKYTTHPLLHDLIRLIQQSQYVLLNTIDDQHQNTPAIIQLGIIGERKTTMILVQLQHLPRNQKSLRFWLIRSLVRAMFKNDKTIYVWGDGKQQLTSYIETNVFDLDDLDQPTFINLRSASPQIQSDLDFFRRYRIELMVVNGTLNMNIKIF